MPRDHSSMRRTDVRNENGSSSEAAALGEVAAVFLNGGGFRAAVFGPLAASVRGNAMT
jgi:hypothetical protein